MALMLKMKFYTWQLHPKLKAAVQALSETRKVTQNEKHKNRHCIKTAGLAIHASRTAISCRRQHHA